MFKLRNKSTSPIQLTAPGLESVIVFPHGRPRGFLEGDESPDTELSDEQAEAFAAVQVGPPGKQIGQLDYFAQRGLEVVS